MKVVIAGGRGHVGTVLRRAWTTKGHDLVILSRSRQPIEGAQTVVWDGVNLGAWADHIDGADVVINLAGRSVDCRYSSRHLAEMLETRLNSTTVIGQAIARSARPPAVWLQAGTATIYAHRFDASNDEATGILGGNEPDAPLKWNASIAIARAWEEALETARTPQTRKVMLRSAMVMSPDSGSVFDVLRRLTRWGLGGTMGDGRQFISWIHAHDFGSALEFLIRRSDLSGPINICSPEPLPNASFMETLRGALGRRFGLPAKPWMIELGCWARRTESELVLKSRRVVPGRLLEAGFTFKYPSWRHAVRHLTDQTATRSS